MIVGALIAFLVWAAWATALSVRWNVPFVAGDVLPAAIWTASGALLGYLLGYFLG